MIYSNLDLKAVAREFHWGTLKIISLGEKGRGRKELIIPTTSSVKKGINEDLSISLSKRGNPKIESKFDSTLYLLLSSEGGYTRKGDGYFEYPEYACTVLNTGNGADGEAGRIGSWKVVLLKVDTKLPLQIKIKYSGGKEPSTLFINYPGSPLVTEVPEEEIELYADVLAYNKVMKVQI